MASGQQYVSDVVPVCLSTTTGWKTKFSEPYSCMDVAGQLMPLSASSQNTCSSACNHHRTEPLRQSVSKFGR